jgi:hypothetical protein
VFIAVGVRVLGRLSPSEQNARARIARLARAAVPESAAE